MASYTYNLRRFVCKPFPVYFSSFSKQRVCFVAIKGWRSVHLTILIASSDEKYLGEMTPEREIVSVFVQRDVYLHLAH